MAFPNDSPFGFGHLGKQPEMPDHPFRAGTPLEPVPQSNVVTIPVSTLEQWINSLELAENGGDVGEVVLDMRSYFKG